MVITPKGAIFMWGENAWGQLGLGDTNHRRVPVRVRCNLADIQVKTVSTGSVLEFSLLSQISGACIHGDMGSQRKNVPKVFEGLLAEPQISIVESAATVVAVTGPGR